MVTNKGLKKVIRPIPFMRRLLAADASMQLKVDWHLEIAESLMYVLNAHQGSAMGAADFGLPDFNPESVSVQSLRHYEQNLKILIRKYEPRFKEVEVVGGFDSEYKNRLIFHFRGFVENGSALDKVNYYSVMTDHGRVMMRGAA
ncbi:MAG: type VI secretion system baseplate subunit TssE [Gammaproteobacteria bacterium]|nr:type VI secretion system baseplate subunit TssE [Gammaproteobacteria bacterium]